ncbi:Bac_surface_Ag domain-containing protein, partial [Haematococcus lacustris]
MDSEESEPAKESKWLHLITPTDDIDAVDGRRSGNNRCVEVVIEGWPSVGSLPKQHELQDLLNVQEGHVFDYADIVDDKRKIE